MGQSSSQPERREVERPLRRARGSIRRAFRHGSQSRGQDGLQDGLLRDAPQHSRSRPASVNRLSQLFRLPTDIENEFAAAPEMEQAEDRDAAPRPRRSRSRFQEMFRRGESGHSIRPHFLQHRTSYVRAGPSSNISNEDDPYSPPRLPSIDVTSTFDHDTFGSPPDLELTPRTENAYRRSGLPRLTALRPDRPFRHLTHSLRRRNRSPPASISSIRQRGNEDQAAMLSRLLSVAAAATAATLMGDDHNALGEARTLSNSTGLGELAGSGEDGSFDGFLRALQNGRIASALRQGGNEGDASSQGSEAGSLNFFRMFRFGASTGVNSANGRTNNNTGNANEAGNGEGRMVPIIIVGIRSISPNSNSGSGSPTEELPPFIDALGNFPSPLPAHALGAHTHESIDSILRPPQNGTSFRHRRRASMGGFGMGRSRLSDRMDDQRDHRSPDRRRERPWSVASSTSAYEPRPPPATPASPSPELSRISSRNTTPSHSRSASMIANSTRDLGNESRRNSMLHRSSAASPLRSHREETASINSSHSTNHLLTDPEPHRIHRRSDTAPNIHYPRFASGHPRRNGVVEPDNLPPLSRASTSNATEASSGNETRNSSGGDSRSWIIYVLGGSYPENHPILTTPSLFTENPTYEDMMLLSALLGPAKPPVATDEDVQSAGGLYNIVATMGDDAAGGEMTADATKTATLVAVAVDESDRVLLETGQRCLVCLCDFEVAETARKLVKCNHLFHKECIDQWLTTGRNSCPLCREQGVTEKDKPAEEEEAESRPVPAAAPESDAEAGAERQSSPGIEAAS